MTTTQTEDTTENVATDERIRLRAYELYLQRGDAVGTELDDWIEAEREILSESELEKKPLGMRAKSGS